MRDQKKNQGKASALLPACRLYHKTNSTTGAPYLMGRMGGVRILILPKRDGEEGEHTHNLLFGEAPPRENGEGRN